MINLKDTTYDFDSLYGLNNTLVIHHFFNKNNLFFCIKKDSYESLFNIKTNETICKTGVKLLDIIHEDDIELFSISNTSSPFDLHFRALKPNGEFIILKGNFTIDTNHTLNNCMIFKTQLIDVRSLYEDIEETNIMRKNFQAMMEETNDFIFFKDANHVLTASSDSLARITGHQRGHEIVGKIDYELFPKEHSDFYYKLEKEIYNGDIPYIEEIQPFLDENGKQGWVNNRKSPIKDENGKIVGLYGIARVVTENIENKLIIEDQKKRLEKAQEVAHLGYWDLDLNNNKLTWSDEIYKIFEVDRSITDINYEFFLKNVHPEDIGMIDDAYKESLNKKMGYEIIHRLLFKDNRTKYIQERIEHKFNEEGEIIGSFGTTLDITNLKEYENEIKQKDAILISQSRNAAMGEMISMIAHQWRQPLSVISMEVNNILLDIEIDKLDKKELIEYIKTISEQTEHLSKTINDFKDYFSPTQNKEKISLESILNETKDVIEVTLKHHHIKLLIQNNFNPTVYIHKRELMQVLLNLINNSKDAFNVNDLTERKVTITTKEDKNAVVILVSDNAGGIKKEIINDIFDPYFTTKSNLNGTGIGLYMSKIIIEKHLRGKLLVKNIKNGVCFKIYIPKDTNN